MAPVMGAANPLGNPKIGRVAQIGGWARAAKLTPERRIEIARKAARARWSAYLSPRWTGKQRMRRPKKATSHAVRTATKRTGHALVIAWALWRALAMAPGQPHDAAEIVQAYPSRDLCMAAAIVRQRTRNAVLRRNNGQDEVAVETFTCLEEGADPTLATFE